MFISKAEEKRAKQEAKRKAMQNSRAVVKKKVHNEARVLENTIRSLLKDCGLTNMQIANCAGLDHSTVMTYMKGRYHVARVETAIALLKAAGYRLRIEPIEPENDACREFRLFPLPPVVKK